MVRLEVSAQVVSLTIGLHRPTYKDGWLSSRNHASAGEAGRFDGHQSVCCVAVAFEPETFICPLQRALWGYRHIYWIRHAALSIYPV